MARDKYEISIWEDKLVAASGNIPEHFEEEKVVIIGSDTMTAACRAYEPRLVENINGTNTFTFKMFYVYTDEQTGEKRTNPFLSLLVNERKIKVLWKNKWYDLVVKNIQEDSSGKSITYTCKDLFINELSKNGFNLEFSDELENNQGTVLELGERVLEGTEWRLDRGGSDTIQQQKEEPVYVGITNEQVVATNETDGGTITIPSGKTILIFYSCVQNQSSYLQFLYDVDQAWPRDTNSQLVIDVPCCSYTVSWSNNKPTILSSLGSAPSNDYRGSRLVRSQKSILDPLTDKYVKIYKATKSGSGYETNNEIYGYESVEFKDPTFVNNIVVNNKNFASTEGWLEEGGDLVFQLDPPYTQASSLSDYTARSYLRVKQGTLYNAGIRESVSYLPNGMQKGEKFVFRYKAKNGSNSAPGNSYITSGIVPHIYKYTDSTATKTPTGSDYISRTNFTTKNGWTECTCTCLTSFSRNEIFTQKIGLFFEISGTYWIEEIEFYPYIEGEDGRINPGEMDHNSVAQTYYHYYNHTTSSGILDIDDLNYLYVGTTEWDEIGTNIVPEYNENFVKIRSITAKQSNRFNLLQSLAETFECWCQFEINHDETGKVIYDENGPQKYVRFKETIGQETGIGFIYGIDLKTISRTIQSDQIVTKTIVSANSNEFAQNGFCTIARSDENYARDTFILNFDYYITQGLIDGGQLNKDLYSQFNGDINRGYYTQLRELNKEYDSLTELLVQKKTELTKQESYKTVYDNYITALQEESASLKSTIMKLANVTSWTDALNFIKKNPTMEEIETRMNAWRNCENNCNTYLAMQSSLNTSIQNLKDIITAKESRQEDIVTALKELNYAFYKKYAHYIQEGSWIDENYIDDTLYYFDAQSVAYTSSRPQISYNISVARLSSLEEFKSKVFHLGDISYIQDTEFFGYVVVDGINTPYKEQVLISEVTSNFDDPVQDTFKVQNYKTQFEDLFQRITATTQSLQYASGEYARAASIVETTGVINTETLQNSIAINNNLVIQANNEQILQDSTGITVTDATNPNKKTKITSGGVFISTDGGATWKNAIRGEGIATQYLTSGSINTNSITLLDGAYQTFRWDSSGINAYYQLVDKDGKFYGIDLSKAVRFDHFGIYGIDAEADNAELYLPEDEDQIWEEAKFGMTWKGFFLHNKYGKYNIEVSSIDDIRIVQVQDDSGNNLQNPIERIKIGLLDSQNDVYGFRIKDGTNTTVLETKENGTLWLEEALNIGTTEGGGYLASIGHLPLTTNERQITYNLINLDDRYIEGTEDKIHRTLDINNRFVVWEDGTMYAKDGYFEGTVNATDGVFSGTVYATDGEFSGTVTASAVISQAASIGNMTIGDLANAAIATEKMKRIDIECDQGFTFTTDENGTTPTSMTLHAVPSGFDLDESATITWEGSTDLTDWTLLDTGSSWELTYINFTSKVGTNNTYHIRCTYSSGSTTYIDIVTVNEVQDGSSPIIVQIESSTGNLFINHNISATLTARVYKGGEEITSTLPTSVFTWTKTDKNGQTTTIGTHAKFITINETDIDQKAQFSCSVII